jgi:hypothetical protein
MSRVYVIHMTAIAVSVASRRAAGPPDLEQHVHRLGPIVPVIELYAFVRQLLARIEDEGRGVARAFAHRVGVTVHAGASGTAARISVASLPTRHTETLRRGWWPGTLPHSRSFARERPISPVPAAT